MPCLLLLLTGSQLSSCQLSSDAWRCTRYLARWLSETHRDTLTVQRAAATKKLRAEVKLVTCAQLSDAGS